MSRSDAKRAPRNDAQASCWCVYCDLSVITRVSDGGEDGFVSLSGTVLVIAVWRRGSFSIVLPWGWGGMIWTAWGEGGDLVVVALPGVQRFIAEARSTADVSAASEIYPALAEQVVNVFRSETGAQLILPVDGDSPNVSSSDQGGMPNRVVALLPAGTGAAAARRASEAVHEAWQRWVRRALEPAHGEPLDRKSVV